MKKLQLCLSRWSFIRGADYRDLSRRILVFWKEGHLWEVVMNERCLHMEVQPYVPYHLILLVLGNLIMGN